MIKQISVFLKDQLADLAAVTRLLSENDINIRAMSIADADAYGVLRLIVSNPDEVYCFLKYRGYSVHLNDVLAFEVVDKPGGLAEAMQVLADNNIAIEYLYAFIQKSVNAAIVVLQTADIARVSEILRKNDFILISGNYISTL